MRQATEPRERPRRSDPSIIRSLDRGLRILDEIIAAPGPVRLHELVERFGIDKASAYRFLTTLERYHLIEKDTRSKAYSVGGRLQSWLAATRPGLALVGKARSHLQTLVDETGHSGHLGVLSRGQVLLADYVGTDNIVSIAHSVGTYEPLYCAAVGKAILAFLPDDERLSLIDGLGLEQRTARTITDKAALEAQLEEVRRTGWAYDDAEVYEDVCCVGAPVRNGGGYPLCSVGVSLVRSVIERNPDCRDRIAAAVRRCARGVERDIAK